VGWLLATTAFQNLIFYSSLMRWMYRIEKQVTDGVTDVIDLIDGRGEKSINFNCMQKVLAVCNS
jgi:hypothetical protein